MREKLEIVSEFYGALYSTLNFSMDQGYSFLDIVNIPRLSEKYNNTLEKPKGAVEIRMVINTLKPNKPPVCDALTGEFYF